MSSTVIRFTATQGHELAARLDSPPGQPRAYAIFAHCFTCSKESKAAAYISRAMAGRGIAVLRFDFTGLGASGGEFASSTFSSNVQDVVAAAQFLAQTHGAPQILIGHSLGGAAVLAAAGQIDSVRAVATLGAPFDPAHVEALLENKDELIEKGEASVDIGGRPFRIRKAFLDDLRTHNPAEDIGSLRKALLVLHGPHDQVVSIDNASKIFLAAKHPKSFVSLDDADHLLTRAEDAAYCAEVIAAWASRYLGPEVEAPFEGVRVVEAGQGKFAHDVYAGRHRMRADEPVAFGGDDSGPSPYDLLAAALGTCTGMTIRMYADRKQIPLERVTVELRHDKVHAEDCAHCDTREGKIDRIERIITLEGTLDAAQRETLLSIANKCPVHRTLESEIWVPTSLR